MTRLLKFVVYTAAFLALIAAVAALLPARALLETTLKSALMAHGFSDARLTLSSIGLNGLTLDGIRLGKKAPLTLGQLTASYSSAGLAALQVRNVALKNLTLEAHKENDAWIMAGKNLASPDGGSSPLFPATPFFVAGMALDDAQIDSGLLNVTAPMWQAHIPFSLTWSRKPAPLLLTRFVNPTLRAGSLTFKAGEGSISSALKPDGMWQGSWNLKNIAIIGMEPAPPFLQGSGKLSAEGDSAIVNGKIQSPDEAWKLVFEEHLWPGAPEKSFLRILETAMPWKGGALSTREFTVHTTPGPIDLTLNIDRVSAEALMQQLTGKPAAASGALSGFLPVTVGTDGSLAVHNGKLEAVETGVIALPPDAIPGDNEQVTLLRDALADFHYTTLTVDMDSSPDNRMVLHMLLEGHNPGVQDGRPFKVNVNLRGDVLNLVRQNILLLINPLHFKEMGAHAE